MSVSSASALIASMAVLADTSDLSGLFRDEIADGSAVVLVADRRKHYRQADVRLRAPKEITVHRAANAIAWRMDLTREEVLRLYGVTKDSKVDPARGELRRRYLQIIGR